MLKKLLKKFLFDNTCSLCYCEMTEENYICKRCREKLKKMGELKKIENLYYLYYYSDINKIIYDLKFFNRKNISRDLKEIIEVNLNKIIKKENIDGVIIIPSSNKRKRERGYNQVEELLKGINCNIIISFRYKNTKQMYRIVEIEKRKENVKGIFKINDNIEGKNILIFDDIVTTGSTMNEMKKILEEMGTNKIIYFSLSVVKGYLKKIGMSDDGDIYK
ncbi:ComF family protein [uncultured Cetobacterium sp.]|uniref:ComF family protein n=2 Tax=uncultured Cetobacterium sp. TaxID=527638 RepID=UPI002624E38E|nr:phosphoribosyltransferase family protein [uncultured Cetobacterium sp.]